MSKRLWITWDNHRRSQELASEFEAEYYPLVYEAKRPLRYVVLTVRTIFILLNKKPRIVFCQNPSIVLTALLTLLKSIFGYKLVVDRHSNFKLEYKNSSSIKWRVFHFLSKWTIRHADLTIVTNEHLQNICSEYGGSAEILQDKIPSLAEQIKRKRPKFMKRNEKTQVMFVTMFDNDEPIKEMIQAARLLPYFMFYFTGKYKKMLSPSDIYNINENIVLTGFISDHEYLNLMDNADIVAVFTKKDLILNCGAYEAISFNKPLVLSDTPTLKNYFKNCALYSQNNESDISKTIEFAAANSERLKAATANGKLKLQQDWKISYESVIKKVIRLG